MVKKEENTIFHHPAFLIAIALGVGLVWLQSNADLDSTEFFEDNAVKGVKLNQLASSSAENYQVDYVTKQDVLELLNECERREKAEFFSSEIDVSGDDICAAAGQTCILQYNKYSFDGQEVEHIHKCSELQSHSQTWLQFAYCCSA